MFYWKLNKQPRIKKLGTNVLYNSDNVAVFDKLADNSIHAIVTDIPYGISLLGKRWDKRQAFKVYQEWNTAWAKHALRVLKPGAHMIVFMSPVTMHRAMSGIEEAGFEIRDTCFYLHSMGFNHGYDQGQCVEKKLSTGNARRPDRNLGLTRNRWNGGKKGLADTGGVIELTYDEAKTWSGWNTTLKPCMEPCVIFRKPLSEKNVADNLLKWGTGALNTGACRIPGEDNKRTKDGSRYPGNILHDGTVLDEQISRYFYCAKAHKSEKNLGCKNIHPTVKPLALMQYFVRLATPKNGLLLDPFAGSFTTSVAASLENIKCISVEKEQDYYEIGVQRVSYVTNHLEDVRQKYGIS